MLSLTSLCAEPRSLHELSLSTEPTSHNSVKGLIEMLRGLPRLNTVLEVGSHRGVSTETFCHFADHVICVDHWYGTQRAKREYDARFADNLQVSYLRLYSSQASSLVADASLDLVYLDADHSYEAVTADIKAWMPKIKSGGWISGHDYLEAWWSGVIAAVNDVFGKPDKVFEDFSWLVQKREVV